MRAFSVRRNLAALLHPATENLPQLDGLRAISILWVMLLHVFFFPARILPEGALIPFLSNPFLHVFYRGDLGVDIFFVISGFLISGLLFRELSRTGTLSLSQFYQRRAMRLLPAYYLVLFIYYLLRLPHRETFFANLLYVNNLLPLHRQCMVWAWSLAIEEQFYIFFPLLLLLLTRFGVRVLGATLLGGGVLAFIINIFIVLRTGLPLTGVELLLDDPGTNFHYDTIYSGTHVRFGALLFGALARWVLLHANAAQRIEKHPRITFFFFMIALAIASYSVWGRPELWLAPMSLPGRIYMAIERYLFAAAIAYLMLLSLTRHPLGMRLSAVLSWRGFHPIAQLAYSAYLLNPIAIGAFYLLRAPILTPLAFPFFVAGGLLLSLLAALLLHLFLERPIMNLREKIRSV